MADYPSDNWKHRSQNMKCVSCMWWVEKDDTRIGRCRKHSPTMTGFPAVYETDWCGDHKIDEAYVQYSSKEDKKRPELSTNHNA